jgi:hypothetical protein
LLSENQASELYEKLSASKAKEPKAIFQRGWNAAIDFAIKQIEICCDEKESEVMPSERPQPIPER